MKVAPGLARPRAAPGAAARRPAHDAARRDDISWISLIRTARVPYAFQAFVAAGLLLPPQMRDMLAALTETRSLAEAAAFPASMAAFGFLCWYWARAALSARFDLPDTRRCWDEAVAAGLTGGRPFIRNAPLHIVPQAPIPIAGLTGLLLALQSGALDLGVATLVLLLVLWFTVDRRRVIRAWLRRVLFPRRHYPDLPLPPETPRLRSSYSLRIFLRRAPYRFGKLLERAPSGPWPAGLLLAVSVLVFLLTALASYFPAQHLHDPRNLIWVMFRGPTPLLLGCALMVGPLSALAFVLDGYRLGVWIREAPAGFSRPPVISAFVILALLMPGVVNLHALRVVPGALPRRPTLPAYWAAWQDQCGHTTRPIVVALSGGADRAALFSGAVLAAIDAQAAGQQAAIFGLSSISGGSLGAALYLSARATQPRGAAGDPAGCQLHTAVAARYAGYVRAAGAGDGIGPLLAGVVLSDVPRALFGWIPALAGVDLRGGDRAAALERAFEMNADRAAADAGLRVVKLDAPYLSLSGGGMPLWIGQATERDSGARALVIPVRGGGATDWPFQGADDVLAQLGADMPISTAVNATARFPFLEPSGMAPSRAFMHQGLSLIDGGYYDNSGLETAQELADWLRAQGADPILIVATGSGYGHGLNSAGVTHVDDDIIRCDSAQFRPDQPPMAETAADILAPFVGLYQARAGHVDALMRRARAAYCGGALPHFFHFYLGGLAGEPVPLNWVLSRRMAEHILVSAGLAPAGDEAADVFVRSNMCEAARLRGVLRGDGKEPKGCDGKQ